MPNISSMYLVKMDIMYDKNNQICNQSGYHVGQEQSDLLPMTTEDKSKDLASSKGNIKTDSEAKGKSKDKNKKKKQSTDSLVKNMEQCNSTLEDMHNISLEEKKVGSKDKKRKKEVPNKDDPIKNESRKESVQAFKCATDREKKSSKTRKRLAYDENEGQLVEKLVLVDKVVKVVFACHGLEVMDFEVKIDEVEFANERLQNNSYWTKDSADVRYGAKAQEILGQVNGRYVFELHHVFTN
ncbi:hypothetical protein LOK49_LG14G01559 [Camellia lanceoleosa]|uniref:Uncharacterized protein n=1 Tax=Camellia lanceoleosa TaxID=1840588 RepID=A0ACC0FD09_9ERIC|nr:hypothetical protein LOK49_LG14G01559 [Camellia lanceoleosa]